MIIRYYRVYCVVYFLPSSMSLKQIIIDYRRSSSLAKTRKTKEGISRREKKLKSAVIDSAV